MYQSTEKKKEEKDWRVAFWNVAGIVNKDKKFWESLKNWDAMVLSETRVEEKGWEKVLEKLRGGGCVGLANNYKEALKRKGEGEKCKWK